MHLHAIITPTTCLGDEPTVRALEAAFALDWDLGLKTRERQSSISRPRAPGLPMPGILGCTALETDCVHLTRDGLRVNCSSNVAKPCRMSTCYLRLLGAAGWGKAEPTFPIRFNSSRYNSGVLHMPHWTTSWSGRACHSICYQLVAISARLR